MTRCVQCESRDLRPWKTEETFDLNGSPVYRVPIKGRICHNCGEGYFAGRELARAELSVASMVAEHGPWNGRAFQFMRKVLALKAAELADLFDVTPETISRWENSRG